MLARSPLRRHVARGVEDQARLVAAAIVLLAAGSAAAAWFGGLIPH